ncbi:hypothetical protein V493_02693 [Pseudogymnoascus sp. VKM F-4281 (FW-2241)]|nr:hypothetical protein V493_02693 [Pseudogymnoascus sp. VKM F-4281 (FW-2241)]
MVKSYLKYEHARTFGLITSSHANAVWTLGDNSSSSARNTGAGRAVVAANEEVLCWDVKKGELLSRWKASDCKAQVTVIAQSKTDRDIFAVGYEDGSIRIWDSKIATVIVSFNGHKSAITKLAFDKSGVRLASGSRDTDVIVWDLIAEVGLFKLRGHKDQITGLEFLQPSAPITTEDDEMAVDTEEGTSEGFLLTTGKDSLVKIWDISLQHCIETHVAQSNGECWALGISPDGSGCITAGNDGEIKVWSIDTDGLYALTKSVDRPLDRHYLTSRGLLHRQGKDKALEVSFHPKQDFFAVHGSEKAVEIWRIKSPEEVKKSLARKRKRRREKLVAAGKASEENDDKPDDVSSADISEVFVPYVIVRTGGRVKSADWISGKSSKSVELLVSTTNNQLEIYKIPTKEKKAQAEGMPDYTRAFSVDQPGHRVDIRALALSSDDRMLASASNGSLKIWNVKTRSCIRTFECGYALCCSFLPGDKIVVVGTKAGELELFDVASAVLIDTVKAHEGAIWTLQVHPDGRSVVSGSADKSAKFWNFEIVQEEIPGTKRTAPKLQLAHTRTLKVADDVLSLKFSPDSRLLAVALLDNTVKVFFNDSLKLFLNLYGHKLPVLNMDISYDSKLIVTCSADKNVRLWGLDFGDCHKAFFAHQDSILQVAFVPHNQDGNGHHFFSSSKDKMIKYWDGDKFEQIQRLDGHHGEIWALAVSRTGSFLVSASHDKSIRVWEQSDEQIFLEEEKEKELEELYESTLTTSLDKDGEGDDEAGDAGKQTIETLMAGEKIVEALELGIADHELMEEYKLEKAANPNTAPPPRNPLYMALGNISAEQHVMTVLQRIKAAALQDALLVLPFSILPLLFTFLNIFAERSMNIPLTCRILFSMLKIHHKQLVASKSMKVVLDGVRNNLRKSLQRQKDQMGYNLAALRIVGTQIQEHGVTDYIDEETWEETENKGEKKRGFVHILEMAGRVRQPIDVAALERYISKSVPEIKTPIDIKQFGFGQSNPTYQITANDGQRFVIRKKPPGKLVSKTAHQVEREYKVLHALEKTDVPVPKTYCLCEDNSVIGTPFYIMEFLDGRIIEDATLPGVSPAERTEMWHDAVRTLAKLHRVNIKSVGLEQFGRASGFYSRQIKTLSTIMESQAKVKDIETGKAVGPIPHVYEMLDYFKNPSTQVPDRGQIIHGDYKIDNMVFHKTEPRVIGVLDWEMSTIGHPLSDVVNLTMPFIDGPNKHKGFVPGATPGLPTKDQVISWYAETSGYNPGPDLLWGAAFGMYRSSVIMQGIAARYAVRQASSANAKDYADMMVPFGEQAYRIFQQANGARQSKANL